jgi:hypothetical protein
MAVRTKEELLESIKGLLADDTSDESIALLEDVTDTFDEQKSKTDTEDWKKKYEDNDREWRQKYRDRFFSTGSDDVGPVKDLQPEPDNSPKSFDDLFKEG